MSDGLRRKSRPPMVLPMFDRQRSKPLMALAAALALAACQSTADYVQGHPDRIGAPLVLGTVGAVSGSTVGGAAGAAGLGVAGLGVGYLVAPYLEKRDMRVIDKALDKALDGPTGKPIPWHNPHTGNAGIVTAMSPQTEIGWEICRWVRSDLKPAANPKPVFGNDIDISEPVAREDLMICDNGDGWYITDNMHVAEELQKAAATAAARASVAKNPTANSNPDKEEKP
jgi:surface antigen